MRTLMKVSIPVEAGTGRSWTEACRRSYRRSPRAPAGGVVLTAENGLRTGFFVLDLKDVSMIPVIAEPFFMTFGAAITWSPCMNAAELKAGLEKLAAKSPKAARKELAGAR